MPGQHNKMTIISMAVIASALATALHEGVGHGITAALRGDVVTELTSNHLSSVHPDRWVDAGGTIVNLIVGASALLACRLAGKRANTRYFLWLLAALNLLPGAGYFLFSGVFGFGDWFQVILGLPHQMALRVGMVIFGAALYVLVARLLAVNVRPFVWDRKEFESVGWVPYFAAGLFSCAAGLFDPLGIKLLFISTLPAALGGSSGLLWADGLMPETVPEQHLVIHRNSLWWIAAVVIGSGYIVTLGRGISFVQH
jgi:hypothetical protein